jgi:hypothetical protein
LEPQSTRHFLGKIIAMKYLTILATWGLGFQSAGLDRRPWTIPDDAFYANIMGTNRNSHQM